MTYAELLGKSSFSFLEGASQPEEMVQAAKEQQLHTLVICDRDGLYGAVRTWVAAQELGQRIAVGAELSLAPAEAVLSAIGIAAQGALLSARTLPSVRPVASARTLPSATGALPKLALLVQSQLGYQNLCYLLTRAREGAPKGACRLQRTMLRERNAGLILILPVQLGEEDAPLEAITQLLPLVSELFRDRGYIGVYRRLDGRDDARMACAELWSKVTGFPLVATGAPLFHSRERKPLADILHCIRMGTDLECAGTALQGNSEAYVRSEAELRRLFEDPSLIERSVEVANRLQFSLADVRYEFPCELLPDQTADQRLRELTMRGAADRYPQGVEAETQAQLDKELKLICELKLAAYFLCTYEIVEIARSRRILCQGRGSAANSAVCYALGITAVDPTRSSLLFERFLSAERAEPPDIDIDFEHERREEVIQEIYERYGRDRAAMVSEVIRYQAKMALRDVSKVLGLSIVQGDRLSSMVSQWDALEVTPKQLEEYGFDPTDRRVQQVLQWAKCLTGFPRHLSIHVGGFVLSKTPLWHVAPVEPATMPGRTVLCWDKDDIDRLGFFKVDVLGLGMLTAIRKALELIYADGVLRIEADTKAGSAAFDPLQVVTRVPADDRAVYAMVSEADTVGVFQIESRAQMAMLPRLRPQCFYDLVIEVALVRPGPIHGGMVHPYLRRRNKEESPDCPHPDLWPILERTLGVPLFQEQVMQLSMAGAGYTAGEADQLRRDMAAWKKSGRLLRHRERLLEGFRQKGIAREFGEALFEQIKGFGEYGFPESHAASFALLVYLSAWQKVHFPAHFTAAILNSQPMGFYSPSSLVRDAQKHGVEVRAACVVVSGWDCSLESMQGEGEIKSRYPTANKALRLGLRLIKGLGRDTGLRLERARLEAPFASLTDLIERVRLNKKEVDALAEAGALEGLVRGRRQALWAARAPRGVGLFRGIEIAEPEVQLPGLRPQEQLLLDYQRVGLSVSDHPLCHLRTQLRKQRVITAVELQSLNYKRSVRVAGLVTARQRPATAKGVMFMTLEDETGTINAVVFQAVFEQYAQLARHASLVIVTGEVQRQVTQPRANEVGRATPVIHVVVKQMESLELGMRVPSRDFR